MSAQLDAFLRDVIGVVEANSYEMMCLWKEYNQEKKISWKENLAGLFIVVGHWHKMPVCISLHTAEVNGYKILFYDATSQVVHHDIINDWLKDNMPLSAKRDDGSVKKTNAMNFHNVFPRAFATRTEAEMGMNGNAFSA